MNISTGRAGARLADYSGNALMSVSFELRVNLFLLDKSKYSCGFNNGMF